jgi:3-hydroxyisobutyrate dehydrogenase
MRVGFIGLGSQGAPMARRIVDAGYPVTLWARRSATLSSFAGVPAAASPAELAAESDLVSICVTDDSDVEEVICSARGVLAGLSSGGVIAVHSTVHPATCERLAAKAAGSGVVLIDAPVSGGSPAASAGRLLVMAGGPADAVEQCRPVFETFGDPVVHMGPDVGAGQLAKLLNNVLFTANLASASSTLTLGRSLGVDPQRLAEVVSHGSGASFALDRIASAGGTLDRIGAHAGPLLAKDVRLMTDLAEQAGVPAATVMAAAHVALSLMNHVTRSAT